MVRRFKRHNSSGTLNLKAQYFKVFQKTVRVVPSIFHDIAEYLG